MAFQQRQGDKRSSERGEPNPFCATNIHDGLSPTGTRLSSKGLAGTQNTILQQFQEPAGKRYGEMLLGYNREFMALGECALSLELKY